MKNVDSSLHFIFIGPLDTTSSNEMEIICLNRRHFSEHYKIGGNPDKLSHDYGLESNGMAELQVVI